MLRFFSRRKPRGRAEQRGYEKASSASYPRKANKNQLACRIILLDGADLSIDISVRHLFYYLRVKIGPQTIDLGLFRYKIMTFRVKSKNLGSVN